MLITIIWDNVLDINEYDNDSTNGINNNLIALYLVIITTGGYN